MVKKKKSKAKLWFLIHSWLALPIWGFIFFICLTGSIATISQEIEWLARPAVRANPPAQVQDLLSYDAVLQKVEQALPDAVVSSIARPVKSQFALTVSVTYQDGRSSRLYVNPYTGKIQGEVSGFDFRQFVRALHGWLLVPFTNGFNWSWYLVSFIGIPMLISLITGLVVYKRFWRGFLRPRLRIGQGARVFWGDFHRLTGIWSIPFILLISISSIWFLLRAILADINVPIGTQIPIMMVARAEVPNRVNNEEILKISPSQAVALVKQQLPDLEEARVILPSNAYSHYVILGRSRYPLVFEFIWVNPYTAKLDFARTLSDYSTVDLVIDSMRPLHTGDFAGLWLKLVYFIFGVLLTMMVLSGMIIWLKRTAKETAKLVRSLQTESLVTESAVAESLVTESAVAKSTVTESAVAKSPVAESAVTESPHAHAAGGTLGLVSSPYASSSSTKASEQGRTTGSSKVSATESKEAYE